MTSGAFRLIVYIDHITIKGLSTLSFKLIILILLLTLAGTVIQRVSGFGFGIFVMMFFPLLLPFGEATALSSMLSAVSAVIVAWQYRKLWEPKLILLPILSFAVFSALAIRVVGALVSAGNQKLLLRLLGAALLLLSLYFLLLKKKITLPGNSAAALGAGGLSGLMSGLFSMGGPPIVLYMLAVCDDDNGRYMANIQAYFALTNLYTTGVRAVSGLVTGRVLVLFALGAAAALLGAALGRRLFRRLKPEHLRTVVYVMMALSGVRYLILG